MPQHTDQAYTLKIFLEDIKPRISRTVIVPSTFTLDRLHDVIQIVMGWKDYHLHQFMTVDQSFVPDPESSDLDMQREEEGKIRLYDILNQKGQSIQYEYDFGDSWIHTITLEKIEAIPEHHRLLITCLDGKRACPPEDVGGPPGFEHFCEVMKNPNDPEYEEIKEWFGGKFRANVFDPDKVSMELAKYTRWSRPRLLW